VLISELLTAILGETVTGAYVCCKKAMKFRAWRWASMGNDSKALNSSCWVVIISLIFYLFNSIAQFVIPFYVFMILKCRGKAFPQEFMNFQDLSIWECFTLNLTTQGQFIGESGEGSTFVN
jgi:hypothetical protein